MKPLIVLGTVFILTLLSVKLIQGGWNMLIAGNLAMSSMLLFTAFGHFAFSKGMTSMLPSFIPYRVSIIVLTGVMEIAAAILLMIPSLRYATAVFLIIFFILALPANISAAIRKVNYQRGTDDGKGPSYLWFRVPLQAFFIGWTWYFGIYNSPGKIIREACLRTWDNTINLSSYLHLSLPVIKTPDLGYN